LACLFLRRILGNIEHLGATLPSPGFKDWRALLMEIVLTALLVSDLGHRVGRAERRRARHRRLLCSPAAYSWSLKRQQTSRRRPTV
jgi:hypothetical protein